ncbi:MAG: AMP-binding protein, partial [Thiotrichaceae bacterium]|nr:AMP-binding protein [Thiotrichaceae bacterium]
MNTVLWQPSTERQQNANITRFIASVNEKYGIKLKNYAGLYPWSINRPVNFWALFWEFALIKAANKGTVTVSSMDKMPGAKWFPEARLNYAQNLLGNGDKNQCAILFKSENGFKQQLSYAELFVSVSRLAQALRNDGVRSGDRVAAVLPNLPETIIAMLATSSIGAVWSSCSPDFGVAGIIDRFSQINPKVLFVCDGYYFNGKQFLRSDQIKPLLKAIPSIQKVVMIPFLQKDAALTENKLMLWQDYIADYSANKPIAFTQTAFNDPLFILFSSGTTGPPKCIIHGVGGTLLQHMKEHLL